MLAAAVVSSTPGTAAADTFVVTTTADTTAADGVLSLREAMVAAAANGVDDEIVLAGGATYSLTDCGAGPLVASDTADLIVIGNGATVQQTCSGERIFDKTGPNDTVLTLQDLDLDVGPNDGGNVPGLAIRAASQLVLDTVTINGGDAGFGGSMVEIDFGPESFDLVIRDSEINDNTGSGTSNLNPAGILVEDSSISRNTGNGIGISDGSPIEVVGSSIDDNGAVGIVTSGQGFGLQPDVTITNSSVSGNDDGGLFCLSSCRTLVVTDSVIDNNGDAPAAGRGGGITMPIVLAGGTTPSVTVTDSSISGNLADHPGGGLLVYPTFDSAGPDQPVVSVVGSTIDGNQTICADCDGGGVRVSVGSLSISGGSVSGNTATGDGGGISVDRSTIADVVAPATLTVDDVDVSLNNAGGDGGGVDVKVDSATIDSSTIDSNSASGDGGGVNAGGVFNGELVVSGMVEIVDSTVSGNSATSGGGVRLAAPDGSMVAATDSTFDSNSATVAGGGFFVGPTELVDLDHTTITRNSAPAGANIASNGPTSFERSIIAEPGGGGANCGPIVPAAPIFVVPNLLSGGSNWFDDASCNVAPSDTVDPGADPLLGPLADNGGSTLTRLPAADSPIAGLIGVLDCGDPTDQRGTARPAGFGCEPGSVEIDEPLPEPPPGFPASRTPAGDLRLIGTNASEGFLVEDMGPFVVVTYDADVLDPANDLVMAPIAGPFRDVRVDLFGGDDEIVLERVGATRDIRIDGDAGDDLLVLDQTEAGRNANIVGGHGNDDFTVILSTIQGRLWINAGAGGDEIELFDSTVGSLQVGAGNGADGLILSGVVVEGGSDLSLGSGNDSTVLGETILNGSSTVRAGSGDDSLSVFVSTSRDLFRFVGNSGSDDVTVVNSEFEDRSFFNGNGGSDSFDVDAATTFAVAPVIISMT